MVAPFFSRPTRIWLMFFASVLFVSDGFSKVTLANDWTIDPPAIQLQGNFETLQILVSQPSSTLPSDPTRADDLTSRSTYLSSNPAICTVDSSGRVTAHSNGDAEIQVSSNGTTKTIPVNVQGVLSVPKLDFVNDIQPVLYRAGCNSGSCHASQYGKGGFTLSVMGFDPVMDYNAMAVHSRGRRISMASPTDSLLLRKGAQGTHALPA